MQEGTSKVIEAYKKGGIKVVWLKWLKDCTALWKHLEETGDYLVPAPSQKTMDEHVAAPEPPEDADGDSAMGGPAEDPSSRTPGTVTPNETDTPPVDVDVDNLDVDWAGADADLDAFLNDGDEEEEEDIEDVVEEDVSQAGDGPDLEDADFERMFDENEAELDVAYGHMEYVVETFLSLTRTLTFSHSEPSSSKSGTLKRQRSKSPSAATSDSDSDDSDSGIPAKRTKLNGTHTSFEPGPSMPEDDEDEDEVMGSKPPSQASSPPPQAVDDDDDESGEESGEQSEDEDFASGLADEDGWG